MKNTYKQMYAVWAITVLLVLFSVRINTIFSAAAFLLSAFALVYFPSNMAVVFCIGLFPYASLFKLNPESLSLFTICEFLLIGLLLIRKKKINARFASALLVLVAYMLFTSTEQLSVSIIIKSVLTFFLIAFLPPLIGKGEIKNITYMGTMSAAISMYLSSSEWFSPYMEPYYSELNMYVDSSGHLTDVVRASGFFGDPNYCAMFIIITLAAMCVLYYYKIVKQEFWIFFIPPILLGFYTYSKSYFLCVLLLFLFLFVLVLVPRYKGVALLFALSLSIVLVMTVNGEIQMINLVLDRFNSETGDITTGRGEMNVFYLSYLWENPRALIFGAGIAVDQLSMASNNVHNIYIEMLFKLGLCGSAIYVAALVFAIKSGFGGRSKGKHSIIKYLPVFFLLLMYGFLSGISDYAFPFYVVFSMMVFFVQGEERYEIAKN